ncbi:hypothetical protein CEXT_103081 [Caerostris extrusa]|uniref:C2H2-type domain-containing protein n=1 Tax=Caerostris extrusa TaxID=172846 RepID=A0AAV4X4Q7_CAEEX|nr:hypothetical protein CEXT_103081 [Caerostris extrusa]
MPHTFSGDNRSENPISPPRPSCDTASSVPNIASTVDAVDLFPSELEVRDLFSDPHSNLRLSPRDKLLPPPELLAFTNTTGPPPCAPFTRISPVKTWASVVVQHSKQPVASTTPRLPTTVHPSRGPGVPRQLKHSAPSTHDNKGRKHITVGKDPDSNSHVVLLPVRPVPRLRKQFACDQCDFVSRSRKRRTDHMTVHVLTDHFTSLHRLCNDAPPSQFDDFVLPKPPVLISVLQPHLPPNVHLLLLHVLLLHQPRHALIPPGVPLSLVATVRKLASPTRKL